MAQAPQEEPKIPKETTGKRIAEKYSDMMKVLNEEETIKKGKNYLEENVIESTVGILLIIGFVLSFFFQYTEEQLLPFSQVLSYP